MHTRYDTTYAFPYFFLLVSRSFLFFMMVILAYGEVWIIWFMARRERDLFLVAISILLLYGSWQILRRQKIFFIQDQEHSSVGSNSKVAVVSFLAGNSEAGNEKVDKDDSLLYCCRSILTYQLLLRAPQILLLIAP